MCVMVLQIGKSIFTCRHIIKKVVPGINLVEELRRAKH